ncbi:MAG: hypothetical protein LH614_06995 [Pyrinomonadaceae bacterium]|nr:hypothetical protein [Pyrinomonadaceae bacterium]
MPLNTGKVCSANRFALIFIDSDIIFVLKKGRVVESGTHEKLYEKNGTYREIFNASARSLNLDLISKTLELKSA